MHIQHVASLLSVHLPYEVAGASDYLLHFVDGKWRLFPTRANKGLQIARLSLKDICLISCFSPKFLMPKGLVFTPGLGPPARAQRVGDNGV